MTDTDYPMSGETPPSPARSSGFSSAGGSRRGSEASEKMVKVEAPGPSSGEEDDDDELLDEESELPSFELSVSKCGVGGELTSFACHRQLEHIARSLRK